MQRSIILIALLLLVLFFGVLIVWWWLASSPQPTPVQTTNPQPNFGQYSSTIQIGGPTPTSTTEVQPAKAAYEALLANNNPDNVKTYQTVVSGGYALQVWIGDNTGGEALLKFDTTTNTWSIVDPGGGAWDAEGLIAIGVPTSTAAELLRGLSR